MYKLIKNTTIQKNNSVVENLAQLLNNTHLYMEQTLIKPNDDSLWQQLGESYTKIFDICTSDMATYAKDIEEKEKLQDESTLWRSYLNYVDTTVVLLSWLNRSLAHIKEFNTKDILKIIDNLIEQKKLTIICRIFFYENENCRKNYEISQQGITKSLAAIRKKFGEENPLFYIRIHSIYDNYHNLLSQRKQHGETKEKSAKSTFAYGIQAINLLKHFDKAISYYKSYYSDEKAKQYYDENLTVICQYFVKHHYEVKEYSQVIYYANLLLGVRTDMQKKLFLLINLDFAMKLSIASLYLCKTQKDIDMVIRIVPKEKYLFINKNLVTSFEKTVKSAQKKIERIATWWKTFKKLNLDIWQKIAEIQELVSRAQQNLKKIPLKVISQENKDKIAIINTTLVQWGMEKILSMKELMKGADYETLLENLIQAKKTTTPTEIIAELNKIYEYLQKITDKRKEYNVIQQNVIQNKDPDSLNEPTESFIDKLEKRYPVTIATINLCEACKRHLEQLTKNIEMANKIWKKTNTLEKAQRRKEKQKKKSEKKIATLVKQEQASIKITEQVINKKVVKLDPVKPIKQQEQKKPIPIIKTEVSSTASSNKPSSENKPQISKRKLRKQARKLLKENQQQQKAEEKDAARKKRDSQQKNLKEEFKNTEIKNPKFLWLLFAQIELLTQDLRKEINCEVFLIGQYAYNFLLQKDQSFRASLPTKLNLEVKTNHKADGKKIKELLQENNFIQDKPNPRIYQAYKSGGKYPFDIEITIVDAKHQSNSSFLIEEFKFQYKNNEWWANLPQINIKVDNDNKWLEKLPTTSDYYKISTKSKSNLTYKKLLQDFPGKIFPVLELNAVNKLPIPDDLFKYLAYDSTVANLLRQFNFSEFLRLLKKISLMMHSLMEQPQAKQIWLNFIRKFFAFDENKELSEIISKEFQDLPPEFPDANLIFATWLLPELIKSSSLALDFSKLINLNIDDKTWSSNDSAKLIKIIINTQLTNKLKKYFNAGVDEYFYNNGSINAKAVLKHLDDMYETFLTGKPRIKKQVTTNLPKIKYVKKCLFLDKMKEDLSSSPTNGHPSPQKDPNISHNPL